MLLSELFSMSAKSPAASAATAALFLTGGCRGVARRVWATVPLPPPSWCGCCCCGLLPLAACTALASLHITTATLLLRLHLCLSPSPLLPAGAVADTLFLTLHNLLGPFVFLLFALLAAAAGLYVAAVLPETRGRTLQEVQVAAGAARGAWQQARRLVWAAAARRRRRRGGTAPGARRPAADGGAAQRRPAASGWLVGAAAGGAALSSLQRSQTQGVLATCQHAQSQFSFTLSYPATPPLSTAPSPL